MDDKVPRMLVRRLLREPLLHFLVFGAALFALYGWVNRDGLRAPDEVVVDQAQVDALRGRFERIWQRAPTRDELQVMVDAWVREEILYREGVANGLERNDEVVRRRVVQKMLFLAESMADGVPADADLERWMRAHPDAYRIAPTYTLRQVYFDPKKHGTGLDATIASAHTVLQRDTEARVGDPTLLPTRLDDASADLLARDFGRRFADALAPLPDGRWSGPIASEFGLHLVRIDRRTPARTPSLAEARRAVERDVSNARTRQASDAWVDALRARYTVKIDADLDAATR